MQNFGGTTKSIMVFFPTMPFLSCFKASSIAHAFLEMKLYGHNVDISPVCSWI